jgi:hypothetical protein
VKTRRRTLSAYRGLQPKVPNKKQRVAMDLLARSRHDEIDAHSPVVRR